MNNFIDTREMSYTYDNERLALDKITVQIREGSFVSIIGPNASGKSTFARHMNALLLPTGGEISVLGVRCTNNIEDCFTIRQHVGLVFQNPDNQLLVGVVGEDVAFGLCNLGLPSEEIDIRVQEALTLVGMEHFRTWSSQRLSGGQKQKVALASVLAMRPSCLVLDEGTSMLDPVSRQEVLDILLGLRRDYGMTLINITHNMDEAALADRVIVMSSGKIVMDGSPHEVFTDETFLREYELAMPSLARLMHVLAQAGCPVPADASSLSDCDTAIYSMLSGDKP
jgi:energy-coupling factor transport system ATP-binding protein